MVSFLAACRQTSRSLADRLSAAKMDGNPRLTIVTTAKMDFVSSQQCIRANEAGGELVGTRT